MLLGDSLGWLIISLGLVEFGCVYCPELDQISWLPGGVTPVALTPSWRVLFAGTAGEDFLDGCDEEEKYLHREASSPRWSLQIRRFTRCSSISRSVPQGKSHLCGVTRM